MNNVDFLEIENILILVYFSDCVNNVDSRAESIDKKIARLDAELRKYKVYHLIFHKLLYNNKNMI